VIAVGPPCAEATRDELAALARSARHGWPDRFADRVQHALAADHFAARDDLVRAKADAIRLAAVQLLAIGTQRRAWERRMAELLLGARPTGTSGRRRDECPEHAIPGGTIYLSFPGLGDRLAARVAGEIGDHPEQFGSPNALHCSAGSAPVTRRSGKSELVVACRLACNRYLRDAVMRWAFCSLEHSGWARAFYDAQRARRGRGKIIFTASLLSFQGGINVAGYTAAKSGIAGLTRALSNEWAGGVYRSTRSRPATSPPTTPKPCAGTPNETPRSCSGSPRGGGGRPTTSAASPCSWRRRRPTTSPEP
jgi:NAD(P)-dependent dehydrogenase (short-subunit alcohol dehydrogenase family)